ncbi:hypothetical protein BT96DRAFT_1010889 [Gymnopus androsaceus JB14]|uniref:Bacteriophage T5 Orf172 DNA-binding domain-containing protein n=1 Tax=Gymnopus androsaceus JB14 TaxID=1447944 RepID=A0A6A4GA14_9AGAR|nr:hypothetical protein BT96DRAFT_1010889 [Gymnopus androsaceus JB14]
MDLSDTHRPTAQPTLSPMRRNTFALILKLMALIRKSISNADRPGYLYDFREMRGEFKLGRSGNLAKRIRDWERDCHNAHQLWYDSVYCLHVHRAESIAHLLLEIFCVDRPMHLCPTCGRRHREKFRLWGTDLVIRRRILRIMHIAGSLSQ